MGRKIKLKKSHRCLKCSHINYSNEPFTIIHFFLYYSKIIYNITNNALYKKKQIFLTFISLLIKFFLLRNNDL